jgi:2-dehydropantoate 2-reductase
VLVKSWQTERVARQLEGYLTKGGIALTLQNGLGNYETLVEALGQKRVALGVTTVGARMLEPGYVQHTGEGKVSIGVHPNLDGLEELLNKAGFQVEMITDPRSLLWGKLVINAAINPLTALLRVANGELLARPTARELLRNAACEAALVATRQGIKLPYADPVVAVEEVARNTASNISSMLQDVLRGTPTEIDAINGAIIKAGEQVKVPTPVNTMLWQLVKSLDQH